MSINQIFVELAANSSRNFKIQQLNNHKDNELLKHVCFLALDTFTQFYIRKIPSYTPATIDKATSLDMAVDCLHTIYLRRVTGNAAVKYLTNMLSSLTEDDAKVIERIIQKDLKCGVSESTVNKVWPGLVHEYPCMLASAFDQKLIDKVNFPAYVQLKADGMRFNAVVREGTVEFRSRNGKDIQIADPTFAEPFILMANGEDVVFDGELLICGQPGEFLDRKTGNGILNKAVKGTQSKAEGETVYATLWDLIPLVDFEAGVCKTPYSIRLQKLNVLIEGANDRVSNVWTKEVDTLEEAQSHFERLLSLGQEGIILKTKDMIWENKRSKHQIKFKGELECDLKVVDWVEGTGKNDGRMGALVLESACGTVRVGLGTGFSDADRDSITRECIGRIVAVKYNARISDKRRGVDSLFLPVFLEWRLDKTIADTSDLIK
jgi:ATP-dependent DNA ligase